MSAVAVVSPGYPAVRGGVTDHTARLTRHWGARGHTTHLVTDPAAHPGTTVRSLAAAGVTAALLQYVPFLYGRRGLSRFPLAFVRAARRHGIRTTVFVHEPWVPPTRLPWLVLNPLQRRQCRRLAAAADAVVTAVPAWGARLGVPVQVVYVGATLGEPPDEAGSPLPAPVVFSPFASGLDWSWIAAAADAIGATPRLIVLGADEAALAARPDVRRHLTPHDELHGRLEAAQVVARLARAPLVLAPFEDGLTGRRTSALAALCAGARVLASTGPAFDPIFRADHVLLADTRAGYAAAARTAWAAPDPPGGRAARRAWYRSHFDARMLDDQLLGIVTGRA